ncbi:MAG: hypothetical protein EXS05_24000 [Planctomycetaceae bacterium]|nr:hypothetical protein [Planctomycetaceae bacterium]
MKWIDAIERVLEESETPLRSNEISEIAIRNGWVSDAAMAPDHSVQAAIWRHLNQGNERGFVMVGDGTRNRRYWLIRKQTHGGKE